MKRTWRDWILEAYKKNPRSVMHGNIGRRAYAAWLERRGTTGGCEVCRHTGEPLNREERRYRAMCSRKGINVFTGGRL